MASCVVLWRSSRNVLSRKSTYVFVIMVRPESQVLTRTEVSNPSVLLCSEFIGVNPNSFQTSLRARLSCVTWTPNNLEELMSAFVLRFSRRLSRILPNLNEVSRGSDQYSELIRELLTKKRERNRRFKKEKSHFASTCILRCQTMCRQRQWRQ